MGTDEVRLLCTGDLHLGRHPTRVPADTERGSVSTARAWATIANTAVEYDVDGVLLSGDIGDRANRYFEIVGAFETGLSILADAAIPVVAVAGNHDARFLPQLAADLYGLTLLGEDGRWERHELAAGRPVHIDGWSFPRTNVSVSPLETYPDEAVDSPHLGLLHADLDASGGTNAPVALSELAATVTDGWILGHIHAPGRRNEDPLVLYPGSPQPLDPGEPGPHGPWLLTWTPASGWTPTHLPTATLRYDNLAVDVTDVETPESAMAAASTAMAKHLAGIEGREHVTAFVPRITFTGSTPIHTDLVDAATAMADQFGRTVDDVRVGLDEITIGTRPAVGTGNRDDGPIGYLVDVLASIEGGTVHNDYPDLYREARARAEEAYGAATYAPLRRAGRQPSPPADDVETQLKHEVKRLLDQLVAQKEDT